MKAHLYRILLPLIFSGLLSACATNPADLAAPKQPTHFMLDAPLVERQVLGLFKFEHKFGLLPGRYYTEREDAQGTYFRGPSGGVYIFSEDQKVPQYHDGGFWMPRDPEQKLRYYLHEGSRRTGQPLSDTPPPKASVAAGAAAGAVGGALGGAAGGIGAHAINPKVGNSYGQAAATGAGAGLIAGAIIGAIIASESGKISLWLEIKDPNMEARLRTMTHEARPISQMPVVASAVSVPPVPERAVLAPAAPAVVVPTADAGTKPAIEPAAIAPPLKVTEAAPSGTKAPAKKRMGPHSYTAEQFAESLGCKRTSGAWLVGDPQGGSGRYVIECGQSASLVVSCNAYACQRVDD
jgi:hypothetical protein